MQNIQRSNNVVAEISAALQRDDTVGEFDMKIFNLDGINAKHLLAAGLDQS